MVARRTRPDSEKFSNEEALREALAVLEAEVEELRSQIAKMVSTGGNFLAEAAHAIRSPLAITHSYLEILHSDLSDGLTVDQQSFLTIAYENAVKLRQLVDDLVDLAAFETGTARIELAPVFVSDIIASLRSEWRSIAEHKGLRLRTEISEGLPSVAVDEDRLKDVLRRLFDNALRFTPKGGSVCVRASGDDKRVTIEVVDSGVGIPADRIDDSFEVFVQLHRQPGENREGYGLGLPLCRRTVQAFGGTLDLASTEGQGTTVTIRIPVSRRE
jgi:signal transduction histidine kinase